MQVCGAHALSEGGRFSSADFCHLRVRAQCQRETSRESGKIIFFPIYNFHLLNVGSIFKNYCMDQRSISEGQPQALSDIRLEDLSEHIEQETKRLEG